jgi:hypothetical protein
MMNEATRREQESNAIELGRDTVGAGQTNRRAADM